MELNGTALTLGNINLNLTGNDINGGQIIGSSGTINLAATGGSSFIYTNTPGVSILANGQVTLGNPGGNHINYDGTNMNIVGGKFTGGGYIDTTGSSPTGNGILVNIAGTAIGIQVNTNSGTGGLFSSLTGNAVTGISQIGSSGFFQSASGVGVFGISTSGIGIEGSSASNFGVKGQSTSNFGVKGQSTSSYSGYFTGGLGVYCVGAFQSTGLATVAGLNSSGTIQAIGAGRIVLNPITISNLSIMVNKAMWVDEATGLVHAT